MRRRLALALADSGLVALAYYLAFKLRFAAATPTRYHQLLVSTLPRVVLGTTLSLATCGLYTARVRHAGVLSVSRLVSVLVSDSLLLRVVVLLGGIDRERIIV